MFSKDVNNIVTNGQAIVYVTPNGGTRADMGFVAETMALATGQKEETTLGDPTVGYDLIINGKLKQTRAADWSSCLAARQCDVFEIVGANDKATLNNVLVGYDLEKQFTGKTGSFIKFEAKLPGVSIATASSFIAAAS